MSNAKLPAPNAMKDLKKFSLLEETETTTSDGTKPLQVEGPTPIPEGFELVRTWDDEGTRCNECCNGDRCEDPTHYYRKECPYCKGTGMVQKGALKPKVSKAGAEATTKPDYLNKTLRECSREELMEALRVTEEKNKAIDAKSRISPEALDVRAGAEATVQGTTRIDAENMAREATGKSDREIIEKLAEEGGQSKWPEKAAAREAVEKYKERLREKIKARIHKLKLMKQDGYKTGEMILEAQYILNLL